MRPTLTAMWDQRVSSFFLGPSSSSHPPLQPKMGSNPQAQRHHVQESPAVGMTEATDASCRRLLAPMDFGSWRMAMGKTWRMASMLRVFSSIKSKKVAYLSLESIASKSKKLEEKHDPVGTLGLWKSGSLEENFVSTLDDVGQSTDFETKVRRLSLQVQDCRARHTSPLATIDLSHKRCDFRKGGDLNLSHIVKLFHLRYLGLRDARIGEIPVGIEKLQLLQTLDLEDSDIEELPSAVFQLGHLMCLRVDLKTKLPKLPDGKGHLTSLQVLSGINMCRNPDFVRELRNMTMLRELFIRWDVRDDNLQEVLVESLCNLNKIQTLLIDIDIKGSLDIYHEGTMGGSSTSRQV
uniref:Disease resistance R13L4/SHOC-2-like LRR domain-containing protein n=1 Tax=Leersia perrieri TaxID=77586 RepID=A0A0D9XTB2_9ORYZ